MELRDKLQSSLGQSYSLERELGGGGMSRVFVARETALGREVVIKVLSPDLAAGVSAERFAREVRLAARLQHPQIVPVLAAGEAAGLPYYTMPLVEGESLRARIARGGTSLMESISILRDVAHALQFAHAHHIIHRDIKPENILLTGSSAAVTDFGIAKAITESRTSGDIQGQKLSLTEAGISLGTPAYMSPEQAMGDAVDYRGDLYAWGIVAYELIAGVHPFAHRTTVPQLLAAQISDCPQPLAAHAPSCPHGLVSLVMQCLEKNPDARPQDAGQLVRTLDVALTGDRTSSQTLTRALKGWTHGGRAVAVASLVVVALGVSAFGVQRSRIKWAREEAGPEIEKLVQATRFEEAYPLALRARSILSGDTAVAALVRRVSERFAVASQPSGARVYRKAYATPDSAWRFVGTTPIDSTAIPAGWSRIKIEKEGFRPYYFVAGFAPSAYSIPLVASRTNSTPEMVAVGRDPVDPPRAMSELGDLPVRMLSAFEFGRFEVTNREFKRFVDAGGYRRRELWESAFQRRGVSVTWKQAAASFVDKTGFPGPSTWEVGDFPAGEANHPVSGVSWYEASAYARFVGKQLPTVYHWIQAASLRNSFRIVPFSNIQGKKLAPVGEFQGMSAYGAFDVAGNVREWCQNLSGSDRFILGGAWNDDRFTFYRANHLDPFDRSPSNGIRLAKYAPDDTAFASLTAPIKLRARDFLSERPVTAEAFAVYRRLYDYDRTKLDARIDRVDTADAWIRQRITLSAAYGGERLIAYLFLPRNAPPPYQTVVEYPGTDAIFTRTMPPTGYTYVTASLAKSGRAVLLPVYKSTYERGDSLNDTYPNASNSYREHVVMWAKDLRRSVDYLYSRADIDTARIAYTGLSWGGYLAGIMLAVEPRFKAAEITCPGIWFERPQPEVDPINFLPHVKVPVLMVGGRYDVNFPLEISQIPMFRLFGTPPEHKRHVVLDAGHCPPPADVIRETLLWFDHYLGPAR